MRDLRRSLRGNTTSANKQCIMLPGQTIKTLSLYPLEVH